MRIVCQKCSAAYAIDDQVVTAKGVRAQCPRCRNLQLVKHDDPVAPPAPLSGPGTKASPDFAFDLPPSSSDPLDFSNLGAPPGRAALPPSNDFLDFADLSSTPALPVVAAPAAL